MLNKWATKAIKPLLTLNEIYKLAGNCIKQPSLMESGDYATTYVTIEEDAKVRAKRQGPKKPGKPKPTEATKKLDE